MVTKRAVTALLCVVVAAIAVWGTGAARAATGPSAYDETLARAGARLAAQAGKPEAIAALAELAALDGDVPPAALEAALRRGMSAGAQPLVAAQASFLLAHLLAERGASDEAAALRGSLGFLAHPLVIGPFGEGRASFGTAFPPEAERTAPVIGHTYPGKAHDVAWRPGEAAVREGALYLDGLLRPDDQAVAYVAAFVHSDRARSAALRLGSPGPVKVWVNGAPVFAHDVVRPAALDQDAVGIRLERGWNRILIKTVVVDGAWRLYARLTEPSGAPLRLDDPGAPPPHAAWAATPARPPKVAVTSLEALLERRAKGARGPAAADAWLELARDLAWIAAPDRESHAAADAARRSLALRPSLGAYLVAAEVADSDDERRRALERAAELPISPAWHALLLARLGELARTERREARAAEAFRAALARLEALPGAVRALPRVRRAAARLYEAAGRRSDSDRELGALAEGRRLEVDLLHQLAARARARGDRREARARLAAAAKLRPDLPSLWVELARLDEGTGDPEQARAELTAVA